MYLRGIVGPNFCGHGVIQFHMIWGANLGKKELGVGGRG